MKWNYVAKEKRKSILKNTLLTVAILGLGAGVTAACTQGFSNWNPYGWFDKNAVAEYPMRVEDKAFVNAATWKGTGRASEKDNVQTLTVSFDEVSVDMTAAKYIAVELEYVVGNPGLTFNLHNDGAVMSLLEGSTIYSFAEGDEELSEACKVEYGHATFDEEFKGAVLIPVESMAWVDEDYKYNSLDGVESLTITTNAKYNYGFEITVGEVGYIDADGEYVALLDLSEEKDGKFVLSNDGAQDLGSLEFNNKAAVVEDETTESAAA